MYIKLCILILGLASAAISVASEPAIFEKKGKYGLMDKSTGKILLKAKYDTIYPFRNRDYTKLWRNGKYGVINKNGNFYLPCEYKKILFPALSHSSGKKYFWASKDGNEFHRHSHSDYYTAPWYNVFHGPDGIWYGKNSNGTWMKIIDYNTVAPAYDIKGDGPRYDRLPCGYVLFNEKLYSPGPKRKVIQEGVTAADTVSISNRRFMKTIRGKSLSMLIDLASGVKWEKKSGEDLNGLYTSDQDYALLVKQNCLFHMQSLSDDFRYLYVLTNTEYNLKSVRSDSETILPFKISDISVTNNIGTYKGFPLMKVTLTSPHPLIKYEIRELANELRKYYENFVIPQIRKSIIGCKTHRHQATNAGRQRKDSPKAIFLHITPPFPILPESVLNARENDFVSQNQVRRFPGIPHVPYICSAYSLSPSLSIWQERQEIWR